MPTFISFTAMNGRDTIYVNADHITSLYPINVRRHGDGTIVMTISGDTFQITEDIVIAIRRARGGDNL